MSKELEALKHLRILYVEDNTHTSKLMENLLKTFFKEVYVAFDGYEGYKLYEQHKPDLILSDLLMPKLNGIEMYKKIKKHYNINRIALFTALDENEEQIKEAKALGIKLFISKPIQRKEFYASLLTLKNIDDST